MTGPPDIRSNTFLSPERARELRRIDELTWRYLIDLGYNPEAFWPPESEGLTAARQDHAIPMWLNAHWRKLAIQTIPE